MSKWKWIAQDADGRTFFYDEEPLIKMPFGFMPNGQYVKYIAKEKPNPNFKDTLINLETEDYEINDGILTRIQRKTKLDKLIANVKKIDKKAAKWMNKNRNKLEDTCQLSRCFVWDSCEKYDWCYIDENLVSEQEPATATETLKYRVGLYYLDYKKRLCFATNKEIESLLERNPDFVRWLTDWIEVEV